MRRLPALLIGIVLSLAIPELILQITDPFKIKPYFSDLALLFAAAESDSTRGYVLPAGEYHFSNWIATILDDHSRFVPDTHESDCTIALVGDSVTFGYGVNDGETWANVVAQRFPDVEFVNASLTGYNAAQAYSVIQTTRASGFLFTLVWNDADALVDWRRSPVPVYMPLLYAYWWTLNSQYRAVERDFAAFDRAMAGVQSMSNVQIVGFEDDPLAQRAGVPILPMWTHSLSPVDGHADAAGSIQIAAVMTPYIAQLIEATCPT